MQKLLILMAGIFSLTQAIAHPVYRPYASCISPNHKTRIEIMQNVDKADTNLVYRFSVVHALAGNKLSISNQYAVLDPTHNNSILEMFVSYGKAPYQFAMDVSTETKLNSGEYKAYFTDLLGRSVVYCSHHITLGN